MRVNGTLFVEDKSSVEEMDSVEEEAKA